MSLRFFFLIFVFFIVGKAYCQDNNEKKIDYSLKTKFNIDENAAAFQQGTITYKFTLD